MTWTELAAEGCSVEQAAALRRCSRKTAAEGLADGYARIEFAALEAHAAIESHVDRRRPADAALSSQYPRLMSSLARSGRRRVPSREFSTR